VEGVPRQSLLEASDVRDALDNVVREIIGSIRTCLAKTPPALAAEIDKEGAWLSGGGSLLKQFDRRIAEDLGIPVNRTEDPLSTVVLGSGLCLERFSSYRKILKQSTRP